MPMTRKQKADAIEQIDAQLTQASVIYITNYSGLTVAQANDLRGRFRKAGVEFKVLKNTLVRLAMERRGGYDALFDALNGPTAVAFSTEPAMPAKVLTKFLKEKNLELPELKVAFIDGAIYPAGSLDLLANLKSKNDIIGDIIGLLLSPATNVVGALQAQGGNLVGAIKTIAEGGVVSATPSSN